MIEKCSFTGIVCQFSQQKGDQHSYHVNRKAALHIGQLLTESVLRRNLIATIQAQVEKYQNATGSFSPLQTLKRHLEGLANEYDKKRDDIRIEG
jgi:hypothetical protein